MALPLCPAARAQDTATLATFFDQFKETSQYSPTLSVQGSDGNFYGTSTGFALLQPAPGEVFQITPAGVLTTIHTFTGDSNGGNPTPALLQASDGNFYGTTGYGTNGSTVFRVTPAGGFSTFYSFGSAVGPTNYPLAQDRDGNFYGTASSGGANGGGMVYQITPAAGFTCLYSFPSGGDGAGPSGLTLGEDGNFYGTTQGGGDNGGGMVYRITPAGTLTTIFSFPSGSSPTGLVLGTDGNFYGTTETGGASEDGTVFRVTPEGELTTLHSFAGGGDGALPVGNLVQSSDGNFYGMTIGSYYETVTPASDAVPPTIYQITPAGVLTTLLLTGPINRLIPGSDGSFYATDAGHGAVKLTVVAHPAFFTGQAPFNNGVNYLAFANGNSFGYYSFLTDPHYLYHFDLGYEDVMDADDGQDGVYFYDFASQDFFYTSPSFPFPYLYDFNLRSILYYYPDPSKPGHYTSNPRTFYDFGAGQIISK